jgi:hypothetical protein
MICKSSSFPLCFLLLFGLNLNCQKWRIFSNEPELENGDFDDDDDQLNGIPWPELVFDRILPLPTLTRLPQKQSPQNRVRSKSLDPAEIQYMVPAFSSYVHFLENIKPFFGGFLGLRGNSKIYVVENQSKTYRFAELYPHVIQVLSREYGCFIKKKISWEDQHQFVCRDRRNIFAWYHPGLGWTRLVFRQFDQFGYEIKVKRKMVVRISDRSVLDRTLKPDIDAH